jgi:hypothetical protein
MGNLNWLLQNLDQDNVLRAKSVIANWVYAGQVTTDQLIAGNAKIDTALIEDLIVGSNVTMGPNATISWSKVTDQPSIPSQYTDADALAAWEESNYATYIDAYGVYSGSFNGGMFNINPLSDPVLESGLTIGGYYGGSWTGEALRIKFYDEYPDFPRTVATSAGDVTFAWDCGVEFLDYVYFQGSSTVYFSGNVNMSGANVTGLNVIAKYA